MTRPLWQSGSTQPAPFCLCLPTSNRHTSLFLHYPLAHHHHRRRHRATPTRLSGAPSGQHKSLECPRPNVDQAGEVAGLLTLNPGQSLDASMSLPRRYTSRQMSASSGGGGLPAHTRPSSASQQPAHPGPTSSCLFSGPARPATPACSSAAKIDTALLSAGPAMSHGRAPLAVQTLPPTRQCLSVHAAIQAECVWVADNITLTSGGGPRAMVHGVLAVAGSGVLQIPSYRLALVWRAPTESNAHQLAGQR